MQTEPPPSSTFSETVNQWVIYDAYVDYEYKKEMQDEQDLKGRRATDKQTKKRLLGDGNKDDGHEISQKVVRAAKVLERMVNQNIYIDIALGILWYNIQLMSNNVCQPKKLFSIVDFYISKISAIGKMHPTSFGIMKEHCCLFGSFPSIRQRS